MILKRKHMMLVTMLTVSMALYGYGQQMPKADRGIHLSGDTISLHFTVYKYFPFITADINGVKGKLLFDTGAGMDLELDDKVLDLKNGKPKGRGFVGSGQAFSVNSYDTISHISLDNGRLTYADAGPVGGHDFSYMNKITPDILGLIGYNFFKGYLFKLDYKASLITFYKNTPQRSANKDFLANEKLVAVLDFETRKLINHPVIRRISGNDTLAIAFDTGQLGSLALSPDMKKDWSDKGKLITKGEDRIAEIRSFQLPGLADPLSFKTILYSQQAASGANKAIGITEQNTIDLGYSFLTQYKTIWDFDNKKIYLLKP